MPFIYIIGILIFYLIQFFFFYSVFNHIKQASDLRLGCDYSLFKSGIRPMWEDETNKNGGRWLISLDKKQRNHELNAFWLEIVSGSL